MYLSKSDFLKYRTCPSYFWLWKHKRELVPDDTSVEVRDNKFEQGNQVEAIARQLFPSGVLVSGYNTQAQVNTKHLIADGNNILFQATVITDNGLLAMADILERNGDGWNIYEVKSSSEIKKDQHLPDVAFQRVVFETAGYKINHVDIIHINKDFVLHDLLINAREFMVIQNVDDEVAELLPTIRDEIILALAKMEQSEIPTACPCRQLSRGKHCPTFSIFNPDVPKYSVYDISRMQGKKLAELVDAEILNIVDIPDDYSLTDNQKVQVDIEKSGNVLINYDKIQSELNSLEFPLYFIDYESVNPAIPFINETKSYQQVIFQYSLHIIDSPQGELRHTEYLSHDSTGGSLEQLVAQMRDDIGDVGSVIVWNKAFECTRNKEMAAMFPKYASFLEDVNNRIYDLMEIFRKNYYVDPKFHGSNSIKDVLPVLAPHLSYKELNIGKGDLASVRWFNAVVEKSEDKQQVFTDLLEYCGLDTLAMVEIYKKLVKTAYFK